MEVPPPSCDVKLTIKDFKAKLSSTLGGMPGNKMQLKHAKWGFLKDSLTLAHFNLGPGSALELVTKKRWALGTCCNCGA